MLFLSIKKFIAKKKIQNKIYMSQNVSNCRFQQSLVEIGSVVSEEKIFTQQIITQKLRQILKKIKQ
jgi:hypothetical protein